jgi:hypothetical protein
MSATKVKFESFDAATSRMALYSYTAAGSLTTADFHEARTAFNAAEEFSVLRAGGRECLNVEVAGYVGDHNLPHLMALHGFVAGVERSDVVVTMHMAVFDKKADCNRLIKELETGSRTFGVDACPQGSVVAFDGSWMPGEPGHFCAVSYKVVSVAEEVAPSP